MKTESNGVRKIVKKRTEYKKHLDGYISRRRRIIIRKRAEIKKQNATKVNQNQKTLASGSNDVAIINEPPHEEGDLNLNETTGRSQRVRKTVQPYMHLVPPKSRKKVDRVDTSGSSKQYINPMHLKQEQIKITKVSSTGSTSKAPTNTILNHFQAVSPQRNKHRINYNEDLVDEAFMYEEMLLNKPKMAKPSPTQLQAKNKAIDDAVKMLGTEITLVPLSAKKNSGINNNNSSCSSSTSSTASNPKLTQTNLSSDGISIYRKPTTSQPSKSTIQISDIKSLCAKKPTKSPKSQQKPCKFCKVVFDDEKQLAVHQLKHLSIAAVKVDKLCILSAQHRRVSFDVDCALKFQMNCLIITFSSLPLCRIRLGSNGYHARWQIYSMLELLEIVREQYEFGRSLEQRGVHALLHHLRPIIPSEYRRFDSALD